MTGRCSHLVRLQGAGVRAWAAGSEAKPLPAISPGKTVRIDFAQNHPLASIKSAEAFEWLGKNLYSFLGEVPLGHYEALVTVAGAEAVIGKRNLSLTLYYRSTPAERLGADFPAR